MSNGWHRCDKCGGASIADGKPVPLADVTDPFTGGTRPAVENVASGTSTYPIHHEASLLLPYLPDPLAVAAVLCGLPGVPAAHQADIGADGSLVIAPSDLDRRPCRPSAR
jgi:hypothetical protein